MLNTNELKAWLHSDLKQLDKLLVVLATFDHPCTVQDLKDRAREAGLKITKKWNPGSTLGKSKGLAISTTTGWEITDAGRAHLRGLGVGKIAPTADKVRHDLRAELANIKDAGTKAFVEEAVKCFEFGLHRSAIVMSWLAAMDVLHNHIHANHLTDFNAEATRVDAKWKPAKTTDDFGRMKEHDFLERITAISVIGKNVRQQLDECLTRRNGCGHPNSLQLSVNSVAHHIEVLLMNVFRVF